jgi:hypothetical protein
MQGEISEDGTRVGSRSQLGMEVFWTDIGGSEGGGEMVETGVGDGTAVRRNRWSECQL